MRLRGLLFVSLLVVQVLVARGPARSDPVEASMDDSLDASSEEPMDAPSDVSDGVPSIPPEAPSRPGPPPPLGVRYAEPLDPGRWRLSYDFERRKRQGLRIGSRERSPSEIRARPAEPSERLPRSLEISIHTFRVAYAPHPRFTLVAEIPVVQRELERFDANLDRFQNQTEGLGDVSLAVVVPFIRKGNESSHVHFALDAPTGSIRRNDGEPDRLPFDGQLGNGTVDFEWGWTYRGQWRFTSWGGQVSGRHPIGRNDLGYREGSRFDASVWGASELVGGLSATLRFGWEKQNNTRGRDKGLGPISEPSENPKARGGTRLDLSPGLALELPWLPHQRLSFEIDLPVYQNLKGPQLEQDWAVRTGWQWVF
jgi:hypothetical protein